MQELFVNLFLIASTFTSSIFSGLPINKSDPIIIKKVAIISTPTPVKSGQDSEIQKMEMEILLLEMQLKNLTPSPTPKIITSILLTPTEFKIFIPVSKPPSAVTITRTPIVTSKSSDFIKAQSDQAHTIIPFAIPTINQQSTPANGLNANELFTMVNNYRSSFDLQPFKKDEAVCAIAQNRAPEVYDEIYGTSVMHSGLRAMDLPYYVNENIINFTTEQDAYNWWINDKIHRDAILADYNYSCIACHAYSCSEIFTSFVPK